MVQVITEVALNGTKSIFVDKALIEGPNPNDRGKLLIPLILLIQVSPKVLTCILTSVSDQC